MTEVSVVIGVGAYCNWQEVRPLLSQLSINEQVKTIQIDALASALTKHPESFAILLYSDFSYALRQILQTENADISEAIEEWKSNLIALQEIYRSHRKQVLLFELNDVITNPESFLTICLEKLGRSENLASIDFNIKNTFDALTYDLAQAYLAEHPLLAQANQYALAMAWPLGEEKPDTDLAIEQKLQQLQQLFAFKYKYQPLSKSVEVLQKKTIELEKTKNNLNNKNSCITEKNTLLLEQLHIVQEELEQKFIAEKTLHKQQQEIQKEHDQLKKKLIDQQLESVKKQEQLQKDSKAEKEEVIAENTLLLEQLHLVQEELEVYYLEKIEADKKAQAKKKAALAAEEATVAATEMEQPEESKAVRSSGFLERRAQRKAKQKALRKAAERAAIIEKTVWFDKNWYLEQNPDVAADAVQASNPALHYMRSGGFEGRKPSPNFDSAFYLQENPDVAESGVNPLWHFLQNGLAEGRQPHP